jgi:phosphate-selective porin OprO and OprP
MKLNVPLRRAAALSAIAVAAATAAQAQTSTVQTTTVQSTEDQLSQLTPAQAAQVKAIVEQMLAEQRATQAAEAPLPPPPPPSLTTSWSGGSPRTSEEDRIFKVNGRVMFDAFNIQTDGLSAIDQDYSRTFVRRAFLGVEGQFTQNWKYNIKLQFAPGADQATSSTTSVRLCQDTTTNTVVQRAACLTGEADRGPIVTSVSTSGGDTDVGFDDAYIQYVAGDWEFTIGQNNQVSPLEDRTSSLNIPFNERSGYINAFGFTKIGSVAATTGGGDWSFGIALQGDDFNNPESTNTSETVAVETRATWAPLYDRGPDGYTLIHVGANARVRDNSGGPAGSGNRGAGYRYRARPQTGFGDRFVDTGSIAFAQDTFVGGEFAAQMNEFGMTAEYGQLKATPQSGTVLGAFEPTFSGGYIDFFWSPTGDSRPYNGKDGSFGRVVPKRTLGSDEGIGSLMFGARYDYLDLTDGTMDGGLQKGVTVQATWQPLAFLKFQADASHLDIDRPNSPLSGSADVVTIRSQIEW